MRWVRLPAILLAVTAASASVTGKANADDGLPDLVIRSVDLKAAGKCNPFEPVVNARDQEHFGCARAHRRRVAAVLGL